MAEPEVSQAAVPNESAAAPPAPTEGAADGGGGGGGGIGGAFANAGTNMKNKISDVMDKIPLPTWAVVAIAIVAGLILLCCCFCICKKCCCKKRKKKEGKKGLKGAVDLKSVQMLGNSYKEKFIAGYRDIKRSITSKNPGQKGGASSRIGDYREKYAKKTPSQKLSPVIEATDEEEEKLLAVTPQCVRR